ncbi:pantoate--beta-alanine ligase [Gammaproteobacteria bacterium]|nr:pantoate--beta-alanine ligase [Gammaproteobacteria bacterium]
MICFDNPEAAQAWCKASRQKHPLALVPTMGALHQGHLRLVREAQADGHHVIVSIFVNPLQFDDLADLERYPRRFDQDAALLEAEGATMVFTGSAGQFFGNGGPTLRDPGPAAEGLEGEHRLGHFAGVATIVERLFHFTRPNRAFFGEKDYQQTLVIRELATQLGYPTIITVPTVREADGLAMSSRNAQIPIDRRDDASAIYRALIGAQTAWRNGNTDLADLSQQMHDSLNASGLMVEYAEVRDGANWSAKRPTSAIREPRGLIAAQIGNLRLIDNMALLSPPSELSEGSP